MLTLAIITGIVLIIATMISITVRHSRKPAVTAPVVVSNKPAFTVTINYVTSFIKTYQGNTYVFLNMTIFNKMDVDMDDVLIETEPGLTIINDLNYRATAEKWPVDRLDPVHADTIQARTLNIPPDTTISGYLIVESPKAQCNIDAVSVTSKGINVTVGVRKEKVLMKTGNIRRY